MGGLAPLKNLFFLRLTCEGPSEGQRGKRGPEIIVAYPMDTPPAEETTAILVPMVNEVECARVSTSIERGRRT